MVCLGWPIHNAVHHICGLIHPPVASLQFYCVWLGSEKGHTGAPRRTEPLKSCFFCKRSLFDIWIESLPPWVLFPCLSGALSWGISDFNLPFYPSEIYSRICVPLWQSISYQYTHTPPALTHSQAYIHHRHKHDFGPTLEDVFLEYCVLSWQSTDWNSGTVN